MERPLGSLEGGRHLRSARGWIRALCQISRDSNVPDARDQVLHFVAEPSGGTELLRFGTADARQVTVGDAPRNEVRREAPDQGSSAWPSMSSLASDANSPSRVAPST